MLKIYGKSMKWMTILLLLVVCIFIVYTYSNDKGRILDKMTNSGGSYGSMLDSPAGMTVAPSSLSTSSSMSSSSSTSSIQGMPISMQPPPVLDAAPVQSAPSTTSAPSNDSGYNMQPVANPNDLLPQDSNSQWANLNPLSGSVPVPVDLLQAGYQIGLDTIGQTLKNPNYQLRSDPIIEKKDVGPWMQSTIEPDYGRIPLEIGYGAR